MPLNPAQRRRIRESKQHERQNQKRERLNDEVPALMGRFEDNGAITLRESDMPATRIYVRLYGSAEQTREAWCFETGIKANLGCWVRENQRNEYFIDRLDEQMATEYLGGDAARDFSTPDKVTGQTHSLWPGRSFMPGRPQIWVAGTLKIQVLAPLPYTDSDGNNDIWKPPNSTTADDGTCVDIVSSVPAAVSSVPQYRWVWIALDTTAGAPELVALAGTTRSITEYTDHETLWTDIDTTGYLPLDVVRLITGDVDETTVIESRWKFARNLFGENTIGGFNVNSILVNSYGDVMTNGVNVLTN